jgi:exodeoxyribonuclease X
MKFLVLDTETASLQGGVVDLAVVEIDEDLNIVWQVETLLDPGCKISPGAMAVHHITNEMVEFEPTMAEFIEMSGNPFVGDDIVLVAHNVGFDIRMVAPMLPDTYKKLCTLKLARNLWTNGEVENHQLQTLRYTFGLDAGPAHRAMGDVITCISLLRHIKALTGRSLAELVDESNKPLSLDYALAFGKHKGTKLRNLDAGYVSWLLTKHENLDPAIREALTSV